MLSSTFGSGTFSSIFGCDGSAPLAVETIPAGFALLVPGRKPYLAGQLRGDLRSQELLELLGGLCAGRPRPRSR